MDSFEPKKLALLRILQILHEQSDVDHPFKHDEIVNILEKDYDITVERKSIGRNIMLLQSAGYDIVTTKKGSYLAERAFDDAELRILIDGILASKHIPEKHSKDLIEKVLKLSNKYFKKHIKHVYSVNQWDKTKNVSVFLNIEMIDEAITAGKQIIFDYNKYGADKKLHRTSINTVSPYQMILHNQRYYLMGFNEKWQEIRYYRLDRITNIGLTDKMQTTLSSIKGYENGIDYKRFSARMPYMFADEPQPIEFIIEEWVIDQVIDWFGKDITITQINEKYLIKANISINAMEYWAMQYLNTVEILKPADLRERIKNNLQNGVEKYKGEKRI